MPTATGSIGKSTSGHHGQGAETLLAVLRGGQSWRKAIKPYLEKFIGFYTTGGYVCYKVFDMTDEELAKLESPPRGGVKKRSACLVHIRRLFVNALEENYDEAMWFIDRIGMVFAKEHCFKE